MTDAVAATAETWDAETGSFTYDANGNIKTAPAPYSITAVTYNQQNLPISLTRSGTITAYRYDDAGQRITKQVGAGNTEVYLREGATTLGVFTVNASGTPTSWYFNVVWADRVVGRQPNTGNRSYYHTDVLGSTRAVVQGLTVVESYDFEPWGLLMPGRALGGGTKEGFSGKEQDTETGLDYFGARFYMPALGRWASVDPLTDDTPEWSPYTYVFDNPGTHTDPDGRQVDVKQANEHWDNVAIAGHQKGGVGGFLQAAGATAMSTAIEFFGLNMADEGFDDIAEGNVGLGVAKVGLAVVGNIPLGGTAAKAGARGLDDAARLVEEVATTGDALGARAREIHSLVGGTRTQNATTIAVTETREGTRVVSSSERRLRPAQRQALRAGEVEGRGVGHAEVTGVNAAKEKGLTPKATGASRPICPACAKFLEREKVKPTSELKR